MIRNLFLWVLSGVLIVLASPLYNIEFLLYIFLVPWLFTLTKEKSLKIGFLSGLVVSYVYAFGIFSWVPETFVNFFGISHELSIIYFLLSVPILSPQFIIYGSIVTLLNKKSPSINFSQFGTMIGLSTLYVVIEIFSYKIFHDTLGHGFFNNTGILKILPYLGVNFITFCLTLTNWALVSVIKEKQFPNFILFLTMILFIYSWSKINYPSDILSEKKITIFQPNISTKLSASERAKEIINYLDEIKTEAIGDFIVFPESFYPGDFSDSDSVIHEKIKEKILDLSKDKTVFFGTNYEKHHNSILTLMSGKIVSQYNKQELFPIGEFIPSFVKMFINNDKSLREGVTNNVYKDGTFKFVHLICYESIGDRILLSNLDGTLKSFNIILNETNEDWFGKKGLILTNALTKYKAIMSRTPLFRVANNGISTALDSTGTPLWISSVDKRESFTTNILMNNQTTVYFQFHQLFNALYVIVCVVFLFSLKTKKDR